MLWIIFLVLVVGLGVLAYYLRRWAREQSASVCSECKEVDSAMNTWTPQTKTHSESTYDVTKVYDMPEPERRSKRRKNADIQTLEVQEIPVKEKKPRKPRIPSHRSKVKK